MKAQSSCARRRRRAARRASSRARRRSRPASPGRGSRWSAIFATSAACRDWRSLRAASFFPALRSSSSCGVNALRRGARGFLQPLEQRLHRQPERVVDVMARRAERLRGADILPVVVEEGSCSTSPPATASAICCGCHALPSPTPAPMRTSPHASSSSGSRSARRREAAAAAQTCGGAPSLRLHGRARRAPPCSRRRAAARSRRAPRGRGRGGRSGRRRPPSRARRRRRAGRRRA